MTESVDRPPVPPDRGPADRIPPDSATATSFDPSADTDAMSAEPQIHSGHPGLGESAPVGFPLSARSRLSTGKLVFLVLTFALAPLGAIAVGAGARSITSNDSERQTLLNVSAQDYSRRLALRFANDHAQLSATLATLPKSALLAMVEQPPNLVAPDTAAPPPASTVDPDSATAAAMEAAARAQSAELDRVTRINPFDPACRLAMRAFPGGNDDATLVQIVDRRDGSNLCVSGVPVDATAVNQPVGAIRIDAPNRRMIQTVATLGSHGRAELIYPLEAIADQLPEDGVLPLNRLMLMTATDELLINQPGDSNFLGLDLESKAAVGRTGLMLALTAPRTFFKASELVTMLMPLGMWMLAVLLSWLVVDRILLTPIQQLRRRMALYRPGDALTKPAASLFAAQEVVTLDEMMERLAENVAADKAALAEGLEAQRALTREVHHRVKNNLQIIASLISLHSRDAASDVETRAYRAIQRRVDALAVVHRHLHAESEGAAGIALGTMLSELSVALRHSLALDHRPVATSIHVEPARAVQDVALPAAFFVTELVELAVHCDPESPINIALVHNADRPGTATLSVTSAGLTGCGLHMGDRFGSYERVLTGLSRQLRQPLEINEERGCYAIVVPVIG